MPVNILSAVIIIEGKYLTMLEWTPVPCSRKLARSWDDGRPIRYKNDQIADNQLTLCYSSVYNQSLFSRVMQLVHVHNRSGTSNTTQVFCQCFTPGHPENLLPSFAADVDY